MLSVNVHVWLRSFTGLVSVMPPKWVNDRLGKPQANGFCETPVMPRSPGDVGVERVEVVRLDGAAVEVDSGNY